MWSETTWPADKVAACSSMPLSAKTQRPVSRESDSASQSPIG